MFNSDKLEKFKINKRTLSIAKRQFSSLKSEKTIMLAIFVQLFVALFSSFLVVGFVSIFDPGAIGEDQALAIGLSGDASEGLEASIDSNHPQVAVINYSNEEELREAFRGGEIAGGIHIVESENMQMEANIIIPEEGIESTISSITIQNILEDFEIERQDDLIRVSNADIPMNVESEGAMPFVGFINTVLIPLLIFLPAFISGALIIDTLIEDDMIGMTDLLKASPMSNGDILIGKLIIPLLLGPAQMMAWIGLLAINGIMISRPFLVLSMGTGLTFIAVSLGILSVSFINKRGPAQILYSVMVVFSISAMTLLPELPTNTIGRLSLGSHDLLTILLAHSYLLAGAIGLVVSFLILKSKY